MTHGCTDCGYSYMGKCEVYEDGTCKRDRAEAYTEVEASTGGNGMTELKKCPFCGGKVTIALYDNWWSIIASGNEPKLSCRCRLFMESDLFHDEDEKQRQKKKLIERWNNRVSEAEGATE